MTIIKPPASLEYTEPVAQALWFEVTVFLRVLRTLQGAAREVQFIFTRESSCPCGTTETMKMFHVGSQGHVESFTNKFSRESSCST